MHHFRSITKIIFRRKIDRRVWVPKASLIFESEEESVEGGIAWNSWMDQYSTALLSFAISYINVSDTSLTTTVYIYSTAQ